MVDAAAFKPLAARLSRVLQPQQPSTTQVTATETTHAGKGAAVSRPTASAELLGDAPSVLPGYTALSLGGTPMWHMDATQPETVVPRNLFVFWDTSPMPAIVAACISQMVAKQADWRVGMLDADSDSIQRPPPGPEPLEAQHVADWTRLAAIARYGGAYIDASSVTLQTLENIFDPAFDGLQGFTLGLSSAFSSANVSSLPGHEQMENFAFAAPPNNELVVRWLAEYSKAIKMGLQNYADQLDPDVVGDVLMKQLPYLTAYACFRVVRMQMPNAPLRLMPATACGKDDAGLQRCGPYYFLESPQVFTLGGLNETTPGSQAALEQIFSANSSAFKDMPLIKFRGGERALLEAQPNLWTEPTSYLGGLLVGALPTQPDPATLQSSDAPLDNDYDTGQSTGLVVLIVLIVVLAAGLLALLVWLFQNSHKRAKEGEAATGAGQDAEASSKAKSTAF